VTIIGSIETSSKRRIDGWRVLGEASENRMKSGAETGDDQLTA
jgi:hypothetical protein